MNKSNPIRILHFIGSLNVGGSQTLIMNIYKNIDREKIQFDFIVDRKNELFFKNEIESLGGRVYVLDCHFNGYNIFKYKKQWNDFFKLHKEYKIIHCHVRSVASLVLRIAKKHNLATICHSHGASNGKGIKSIGKKLLQKSIPKYSDYLLACSIDSSKWLYGAKNACSDRCLIINNGINTNDFVYNEKLRKSIRNQYKIKKDEFVIGHVGRFVPVKNHDFILQIAKALENSNIKYRFMLCGDGIEKERILSEISNSGLSSKFIIIDSTNEIYKYYNAFDLFILPSKSEGLGIVLIEAQYNGLTCIVSENIPNEACISDGFVSIPLQVDKWVDSITKISHNKKRTNLLNSYAKNYDISRSCEILSDIYLKIMNEVDYERTIEL